MSKGGAFRPFFIVMAASLLIAGVWNVQSFSFIKNSIHWALDPTLGWLLNWNLTMGMLIIVFLISIFSILAQKYGTDQKTLRELKHEQKKLQDEMKKFREHPEKLMELQKKQMEFIPETMKLSMRPMMFTGVPFILLFRWFMDVFTADTGFTIASNPMFFGFMSWFWFYLVFTLVFSMILRKALKVV
jgi:uncharacterized membrane protein (DUF106 family)